MKKPPNDIKRRHFISGIGACALLTITNGGCQARQTSLKERPISVGKLEKFSIGRHLLFVERLLLVRDDVGLAAMSLVCTHQACMVTSTNQSFDGQLTCPCHGSTFEANGNVLRGPAQKSLPWFELYIDSNRDVIVILGKEVTPNWRASIPV